MERNNIFNEEVYNEVNSESKHILQDYILELKSRGRAVKTIEQYVFDIKMAYCYFQENNSNKSILELKKRDFRNFFLMLQETGKSSARINRVQSSLRNLLEFVVDDEDDYEDYYKNPMKKIKSVEKNSVREIVFLTDEQVNYLIEYLMERKKYQKALYVSLSYDSAARRNEIHQVKKDGFVEGNMTNSVIGKRGKQFPLMYMNRTREIAKAYFEERGEDDIDSLWVSYYNGKPRPLTYETLYQWAISFRSILEDKYDEDIPVNSHSFRHTSLENYENGSHYNLKDMGKDNLTINELRVLANHENIDITQSYLKNKDQEILSDLFS
ncbi:integrase [Staphylococcus phage VB-SauS-SA2]|nr:integrase [Staphylococcus phage VB-SauS-SA2]